ncbi:50s ribosomal protein l27 [Stylonychia lemnae]|uniref:50s ribosomal protein l27 n=1 Tax=Stylonychia lemnae TaxID=5949 RepID=A0A078ADG1_STYLE|nr:50s ribosomal protein l27 [Stylonychia lemnae]|eukprot:CDW78883.1 50s ribosomal protein l27 [Stylonychia lemnae]
MIVSKFYNYQVRSFATKMMAGSTNNKKDSAGRRLGIKKFGGAEVLENEIIARQRGFKWHPGDNTHSGKDHTVHASVEGVLGWSRDPYGFKNRAYVHVIPQEIPNRKFPSPPPFVYHPELYPEKALKNPEPTNFVVPKRKPNQNKFPQKLSAKVVAPQDVQRVEIKGLNPDLIKYHSKFAYQHEDPQDLKLFQEKMGYQFKSIIQSNGPQDFNNL